MADDVPDTTQPTRDRLSRRIHCGTAVVVVPFLISIAIAAMGFARVRSNVDRLAEASHFATWIADVEGDVLEMRQHVLAFSHGGYEGDAAAVESLGTALLVRLDDAEPRAPDERARERIQRMRQHLRTYLGSFRKVVAEREVRERMVAENVLKPARDVTRSMNSVLNADDAEAAVANVSADDARRLRTYVSLAEARLLQFLSDPDAQLVEEGLEAVRSAIAEWEERPSPDGEDRVLDRLRALEHGFLRSVQATRTYLYLAHVVMAGEAAEFAYHTRELKQRAHEGLAAIGTETGDDGRRTSQLVLFVSLGAACAGILISLLIARTILNPVRAITRTFNALSKGEEVGSVPGLDRHDEMGEMARAADVFRHRNLETVELLRTTQQMTEELDAKARELEQRNQDLDSFAYVASHDLKSPLRGVACLAEWIAEDGADVLSEESRTHLAMLGDRIERMDRLLDDLLAYSRAGRTEDETEDVDVPSVVLDIQKTIDWPSEMSLRIEPGLPVVHASRIALQRVFQNLLTNAVKYRTPGAPAVVVAGREIDDRFVEFSVADNGIGIEPRYHDSIFRMFERLHTHDQIEGSGMGLALVRKLVESHDGTVRVESEPGLGATFVFTWPKSESVAGTKPTDHTEPIGHTEPTDESVQPDTEPVASTRRGTSRGTLLAFPAPRD